MKDMGHPEDGMDDHDDTEGPDDANQDDLDTTDDTENADDENKDDLNDDNTEEDNTNDTEGNEEDNMDNNTDDDGNLDGENEEDDTDENLDDEQNSEGDDEEEKIKNKSLLQNFFDLYSKITSIIESLDNVEGNNKFEFSTINTEKENLNELRYSINDYINLRFAKRTYDENLAMYYKITNSLKIADKIISNIVENRSES